MHCAMMRTALILAITLVATRMASGQAAPVARAGALADAVDSATMARTSYRDAREALLKRDTASALSNLSIAANVWPVQPAYPGALLDLALRARDEKRILEAIGIANRVGISLPATAGIDAAGRSDAAAFRNLLAVQNSLREAKNTGRVFHTLVDSTLFPEGLSVDSRTNTLYVSSIYHRNVAVIDAAGKERWLIPENSAELGALFGVAVDTARNVLWVSSAANPAMKATGSTADNKLAALFAIRLSDGAVVKRAVVPADVQNASPGDLVLMNNGDVLMSDSQAGVLWRLKSSSDTLIGIRHRLLRSPQGIVPSLNGRVAFVADYSHGLLRVDLASAQVSRVWDLAGHSTVGIDGLVRFGNSLIAVQNGFAPAQVLRIDLDVSGSRVVAQQVIDRNVLAPTPTGGIVQNGEFVYIANSLWELLDANGKLDVRAALPRPLLLRLPLAK